MASATASHPPLNSRKLLRRAILNRAFALAYACAILALFYHHVKTLLRPATAANAIAALFLLLADVVLAFMWSTTQSFRLYPTRNEEFPENLEKVVGGTGGFPALDVFICTADPYKEPPMGVVNTALSVMAYEYPVEKLSVYVSDDGGSELTLFAFMEAARFAGHWLPFCRERNLVERSPEAYFASSHRDGTEIDKIKMMYESMKMRVEHVVERGKVGEEYIIGDRERRALNMWTDEFTRQNHPAVIEVLLDNNRDRDITGNVMPNLIYLSREKSQNAPHYFKAGALNALLRVSAIMTNAPIILTLDCDMCSNDPKTPHRALCYLADPLIDQSQLGYVQFPQRYQGINKGDIYCGDFKRLFQINPIGMKNGPSYVGTGCFFRRRSLFGPPSAIVQSEIPELSPEHSPNGLIRSERMLALAQNVAGCKYEHNTNWGHKIRVTCGGLLHGLQASMRGMEVGLLPPGEGSVSWGRTDLPHRRPQPDQEMGHWASRGGLLQVQPGHVRNPVHGPPHGPLLCALRVLVHVVHPHHHLCLPPSDCSYQWTLHLPQGMYLYILSFLTLGVQYSILGFKKQKIKNYKEY
ncbi:hypothetical protein EUGRSUZ_D01765 [Eucalyptus grandis]|uniref:Glycosyltransferase 2-like domain-containing protein n=1 Tax=Eucalyptus grandis TaxID=71139 RepID=A0A059CGS7_EUCGR|nr:hypothetical protein EUGRSUZ_D01765 [Eucalyptus grandis]